jgi:hypothetical protein
LVNHYFSINNINIPAMTSFALSRLATSSIALRAMARTQSRNLSSQGSVAIEKLREALEEYRVQK